MFNLNDTLLSRVYPFCGIEVMTFLLGFKIADGEANDNIIFPRNV